MAPRPLALLPLLLAAAAPAQTPSPSTIHMALAANSEGVRPSLVCERGQAVTADGRIWALAYWWQTAPTTVRETRLYCSRDGARTWTLATKTRQIDSAYGSLALDPDGTTLHVAFQARTNPAASYEWSIYYCPFDTVANQWVGADLAVLPNTGSGQYNSVGSPNIAVNRKGHLLVSGIRATGWTTWFKIFDGQNWTNEIKLQGGSYSKNSCVLEGPDECFHFAYQSTGTYTAYYRRYDPTAQAFGPEGEILVKAGISNETTLAITPGGDIFIGYITSPGSSSAAAGAMEVSSGKIGTWQFTGHTIYQDTRTPFTLTWGNHAFYCLQLARSGDRVAAYYAIPGGTATAQTHPGPIYARDWTGQGFGPQRIVVQGPPNTEFLFPLGRSCMPAGYGLMLTYVMQLYTTATPPAPLSQMLQALVEPAAMVNYGLGCPTSAGKAPVLGASDIPALGNNAFQLTLADGIGAAGIALLGTSRTSFLGLPLPLDLAPFGIAGCQLRTNIVAGLGAAVAGGQAALPLGIPADPALAGAQLTSQWLLLDAAAPGGLRFSGGGALNLW